jgi:hypothetical protein
MVVLVIGLGLGFTGVTYFFAKNLGGPWPSSAPTKLRQWSQVGRELEHLIRTSILALVSD